MPKVSVITINYNDAPGLERTINSVVSQSVDDIELVVVDGGSTDGSLDVIKKNAGKINSWISEKDNGIYDAQNKGVAKASGDYLIFLNAGDSFYSERVVEKFYGFTKANPAKIYFGNSNVTEADGSSSVLVPPQKPDLNFWYSNTLNHQAVFMHTSLFKEFGCFNIENKYASDFEHLFKIFLKDRTEFTHFNETVCNYDNTGLTSKDEFHQRLIAERITIMKKYVSKEQFSQMRSHYLNSLPFKRRCMVVIREKPLLKAMLKPFYKLFFN